MSTQTEEENRDIAADFGGGLDHFRPLVWITVLNGTALQVTQMARAESGLRQSIFFAY